MHRSSKMEPKAKKTWFSSVACRQVARPAPPAPPAEPGPPASVVLVVAEPVAVGTASPVGAARELPVAAPADVATGDSGSRAAIRKVRPARSAPTMTPTTAGYVQRRAAR